MKLIPGHSALFALLTLATQAAFAADGTIAFTGAISSPTCSISNEERNITANMPSLDRGSQGVNATSVVTPFSIALSDCPQGTGSISTYFEPGPGVRSESGSLLTSPPGSSKVLRIQLLNDNMSVIKVGAANDQAQSSQTIALESSPSRLNYYARYMRLDAGELGRGEFSARLIYSVTYN